MATEVAEMLDRARETLNRNLISLDLATAKVEQQLAEATTYDHKLGSHLAWVTGKVAEVTSALRQLEKHDRAMSKTPEQRFALVCDYVRELDAPRRAQLMQILTAIEGARTVLA
jgi:septal ring factor EnvC (AmiA/AmiB activator)